MASIKHPIVGTVRFEALSGGRIRLLDNWVERNISTVHIPELKGVPTYGGKFSGNVRFYTRAIPQLKAAFAEIGELGLAGDIIFWDGSFVPRMKRGSSTSPSEHTFGCALDLNAAWNGFRQKPAAPGKKGSLWRLLPTFEKYGFESGLRWRTPDGMHKQVKRLLSPGEVAALAGSAPVAPASAPEPSIIVAYHDGKAWHQKRIPTIKQGGRNYPEARKFLEVAHIPHKWGTAKDGTPFVVIGAE